MQFPPARAKIRKVHGSLLLRDCRSYSRPKCEESGCIRRCVRRAHWRSVWVYKEDSFGLADGPRYIPLRSWAESNKNPDRARGTNDVSGDHASLGSDDSARNIDNQEERLLSESDLDGGDSDPF